MKSERNESKIRKFIVMKRRVKRDAKKWGILNHVVQ